MTAPTLRRNTRQRHAIRTVFETAARPLGIDEVLSAAQVAVPGMGVATVYRNIKHLVDSGWLEPVELPGEPPRYEPCGVSANRHYFRCRRCQRVYRLANGTVAGLNDLLPNRFELTEHQLILHGQCNECAEQSRRA